jgi:hypothetical protein
MEHFRKRKSAKNFQGNTSVDLAAGAGNSVSLEEFPPSPTGVHADARHLNAALQHGIMEGMHQKKEDSKLK